MLPNARWVRWTALFGMTGQGLFLLGFALPYATLASGEHRWFLTVIWSNLLKTLHQGDFSLLFWALLILVPWALYLFILLDSGGDARRWRLWVASTLLINGLTLVAGSLLPILDIFIFFYNAPPTRFRPPVPPIRYSPTFWLPLLGHGSLLGAVSSCSSASFKRDLPDTKLIAGLRQSSAYMPSGIFLRPSSAPPCSLPTTSSRSSTPVWRSLSGRELLGA